MIQVYPFHGTDVQEVYGKLNSFLQELAIIDVQIKPDDIRANTKYYPDHDRTSTTIEVCIDFEGSPAPHEMVPQIRELHQVVVNGKPDRASEPNEQVEAVKRLVAANSGLVRLECNEEGWLLTDLSDQGTIFWGVGDSEVFARTDRALKTMTGADPDTVAVPSGDDFDPFLPDVPLP